MQLINIFFCISIYFLKFFIAPMNLSIKFINKQFLWKLNSEFSAIVIRKVCPFAILPVFWEHILKRYSAFCVVGHSSKRMRWHLHMDMNISRNEWCELLYKLHQGYLFMFPSRKLHVLTIWRQWDHFQNRSILWTM